MGAALGNAEGDLSSFQGQFDSACAPSSQCVIVRVAVIPRRLADHRRHPRLGETVASPPRGRQAGDHRIVRAEPPVAASRDSKGTVAADLVMRMALFYFRVFVRVASTSGLS